MEFKGTDSPEIYLIDFHQEEDENVSYPFQGPRGEFLVSLLGSFSLLDKVRMANMTVMGKDCVIEDLKQCSPKVIVPVGSEGLKEFVVTSRKISEVSGDVFDYEIDGIDFKLIPLVSPSYVLHRIEDSSVSLKFSQDVYKIFQVINGDYVDILKDKVILSAHSFDEFKEIYDKYFINDSEVSYDIETNARPPLCHGSEIIGFSIANTTAGVYISHKSLDFNMSQEETDKIWDFLINEVFEKKEKLIIHNTQYERPYTYYCKGYEIGYDKAHDTLVMARLLKGSKEGAGLKYQAQKNLHYPDWETNLSFYISGVRGLIERIGLGPKKYKEFYEDLSNVFCSIFNYEDYDSYKNLSEEDKEEVSSIINKVKGTIVDLYSEEEVKSLDTLILSKVKEAVESGGITDSTIPYNWIPDRVICQYGAVDSLATYDLKEYFFKVMDEESTSTVDLHKGYEYWLEHMYVAYIMERNGMYWDDEIASRDREFLANQATDCLRSMLLSSEFESHIIESCEGKYKPMILADYLPEIAESQGYSVTYDRLTGKYSVFYNNKRVRKDTLWSIEVPEEYVDSYNYFILTMFKKDVMDCKDYTELTEFYNPSSSTESHIAKEILLSGQDLQMGGRIVQLHTLSESPEFENIKDKLPVVDQKFLQVSDLLCRPKVLKSNYGESWADWRKKIYQSFCSLYDTYGSNVTTKEIKEIIDNPKPVEIESLDDGGIIQVYNNLVVTGMDQDNKSTWTPQFEWMVNFRLFKKSNKLISSYIDGSVGRGSVAVVDKATVQSGSHLVERKRDYDSNISDDECYLLKAKWSPNTAETGRWRSAQHCHPGWTSIKLADGRDLPIEKVVEEFNKGEEIYVYSIDTTPDCPNLNCRPRIAKVNEAYLSHYANEFVRFTLDNGETVDVTPDHKMIRRDSSYCYAIDLNEGDSVYPAYFSEDEKGYLRVLDKTDNEFKYCHYLADEYNVRHGLVRVVPKEECGNNGSWCRHHVNFDHRDNRPTNVMRVGWVAHRNKYHAGDQEFYKTAWDHRRERGNDPCPDIFGRLCKRAVEDPEFEKRWKESKHNAGVMSMERLWSSDEFKQSHILRNKTRGFNKSVQLLATIYDKENDYINLNEEVYEDLRLSQGRSSIGIMKWSSLLKYVDTVDQLKEIIREVAYHNHKIVKKEYVTLESPIPVYSLSIEQESPNYALTAGIFIGNTVPWGSQVKKYYGSRFVGGTTCCPDYSQMEVRTLAAISKDKNMLELFHSGKDFHTETAKKIYRKDEVTTAERRFSKTATFSLLYGAMETSFANNYCKGDMAYAHMVYGGFFEAYPEVKKWVDERHKEVQRDHRVSLELSNRFIKIEPEGEGKGALNSMLRKAQNYPIQAQSADLTGCVIFDLQKYIEENNLKSLVFMYVHDSIEVDIYPYELLQFINRLKTLLNESPMRRYGLPSHADVALGKTLGHEIELEEIEMNKDMTEGYLSLKGYKDEIDETVENWKKAYAVVEVSDENYEDDFVSMGDLFILRKAYTPTLGTMRQKGTCKVHIKYY